jgi:hypothetical protein
VDEAVGWEMKMGEVRSWKVMPEAGSGTQRKGNLRRWKPETKGSRK